MILAGLQKLTLLDFPEHTACTVFLWGCNFRCPFCHNAGLVTRPCDSALSEAEFFAFLKKRQGLLDGVCITGGEPTLSPELPTFIQKIRALGYQVKLDSNGTNPAMLRTLCKEQLLDMVAMDIKNAPDKYTLTAGTEHPHIEKITESIHFLLEDTVPYEFRTTIVKNYHTPSDLVRIGQWIQGAKHYYLQNFVDSNDLIADHVEGCTPQEMQQLLEAVLPYVPNAQLRGIQL